MNKKKSRSLLSLLLSLAMLLTLVVAPVYAADDEEAGESTATETAAEETGVAKIGDTSYSTLARAVAAAVTGDTITLVNNATVDALIEIKSSQNITLDLASYTISGDMSTRMFAVSGTLTITGENGTITNTGSSNAISNGGTLVIESGTITANSAYAIYNTGTLTVNGGTVTGGSSGTGYALYIASGTVTINGGTFTSTNTSVGAVRNNGTLTINAGTVGNTEKDVYGVYNAGTTVVNGGTLSGSTAGLINTTSDSNATVYGGTLQGGKRGLYNSTGTANIYGGTFSGSEYGLMTNSPAENTTTVYAGTFHGGSRAIIGYLTSTIASGSYFSSGSYDQTECVVANYFGISTDATTIVPAEIDSGKGTNTVYVKVSSAYIGTDGYYSTGAYPTTSLTYTVSEGSNDSGKYIFAGWYTVDENGNYAVCNESMWSSVGSSDYYAKFVDANVLSVICVYTPSAKSSKGTAAWRFMSSSEGDYSDMYFLVGETEYRTGTDYPSITISSVNRSFSPTEFSSASKYVFTYGIYDGTSTSLTVRAGWKTEDGTKVFGSAYCFDANSYVSSTDPELFTV